MKVFILNGPPGCGKDTIAKLFCQVAPVLQGEFKSILYKETANLLCDVARSMGSSRRITEKMVRCRNEDRMRKEQPWIGGLSVRRWLQITSEMVVKKDKGADYFGRAAADLWYGKYIHHVISDGGFIDEVNAVCDKFGAENVYVIRLLREGFTFGSDTRTYIRGSRATEIGFEIFDGHPEPAVNLLQELLTKH